MNKLEWWQRALKFEVFVICRKRRCEMWTWDTNCDTFNICWTVNGCFIFNIWSQEVESCEDCRRNREINSFTYYLELHLKSRCQEWDSFQIFTLCSVLIFSPDIVNSHWLYPGSRCVVHCVYFIHFWGWVRNEWEKSLFNWHWRLPTAGLRWLDESCILFIMSYVMEMPVTIKPRR